MQGLSPKMNTLVVLATGGTIAGTQGDARDGSYQAAQVGVGALVSAARQFGDASDALAPRLIEAEQVAQIDSKDMSNEVWQALAQRCRHHLARPDVKGVVVTHGTDTMEETATFLDHALRGKLRSDQTIVITGAMKPSDAIDADGPSNLAHALMVAADPSWPGVYVLMAAQLHRAHDVRKAHPWRVEAFSSGEAGPVAQVVGGATQRLASEPVATPSRASMQPVGEWVWSGPPHAWPSVAILTCHGGVEGRWVDAWVQAGVRGLVVATTGNGTLHQSLAVALK